MTGKQATEQQPPADGIDIPDPSNDLPEPVDVVLEEPAPAEGDEPAGDAPPPKAEADGEEPLPPREEPRRGKNRIPAPKRIAQLSGRNSELEATVNALNQELESLRPKVTAADEVPHWRHSTFLQAQGRIASDIRYLQGQLAAAKTDGTKQAEEAQITTQIAQLSAEKATVDAWLNDPKNKPPAADAAAPKPAAKAEVEQPRREPPPMPPRTQAWYEANTYAVPGHPDHDPEMEDEARSFARKLERRLNREQRTDLVGGDWYFGQIDKHMEAYAPDYFELPEAPPPPPARTNGRAVPPMTRQAGVTAVTRQANGGAPSRTQTVNLTAEERQQAHLTPVGIINPKTGKPWSIKGGTPKEREEAFAWNKLAMLKEDAANPQRR